MAPAEDHRMKAYAALLGVQGLFGILPVAGKLALTEFDIGTFAVVRVVAGALLLVLAATIFVGMGRPPKADLRRFAAFGFFGVALNQGLFIEGLARSTAINAVILVATIPALTYLLAVLSGREGFGPRRAAGMALAFIGVLVLVDPRRVDFDPSAMWGNLLLLANSTSYAWYLNISKPQAQQYRTLEFTAWVFAFGAPMLALAFIGSVFHAPPVGISTGAWGSMVLVILGPTFGTYALNAYALRRVSSSTVAVFIYIQPIVTATLAWWYLDEVVEWRHVVSAGLILAGVTVVVRRSRGGTGVR